MNRTEYLAKRSANRERGNSRTDLGLPQHPAFGFITCPDCEGAGEFEQSRGAADPNPIVTTCGRCYGDGSVWDSPRPADPLLRMASERRVARLLGGIHVALYRENRKRAMRPAPLPCDEVPSLTRAQLWDLAGGAR